ncbi:MAG TPA: DivIVA domain-containing protein [Acidimicrobiia bacterium]|nr:DivIVA domain-containing protein [Acidimicrobiia bacterium]
MDQELTPGDIAARRFRQAFRGFDTDEVTAFLSAIASQLEGLVAQRDRLAGRLGEFAERDLSSEFATLGHEIGNVLEAARIAAEGMRERASTDAARWRTEAMDEVEAERRAARADAEHLRTDAWTTSEDLLKQAQAEARRTAEAAERDSLSVLGEAEREAHRLTAGARREAEDLMRITRMEAEKLNAEARSRHDEIIEQARRQAESAQERARALEQRRQELIGELETLRSTLSRMEGELDERRTRLGLSATNEAIEEEKIALRVVRPADGGDEDSSWEPGETVRVVPSKRRPLEPPALKDPEPLVDEVRRMRKGPVTTSTSERPPTPSPPPAVEAPEPEPEALESEPTQEDDTPDASDVVVVTTPPPIQATGVGASDPSPDDVQDIFRRLRSPVADSPLPPVDAPAASFQPAAAKVATTVDPFDLRERLLLPVTNRALRNIKRQLTELQNLALEELRHREAAWRPEASSVIEQLRPDVVVLLSESSSMGHGAAEEMLGQSLPRIPVQVKEAASELGASLTQQLEAVMASAGNQPSRELAASISRVFRGWRTDEAERRITDLAADAYHRGIVATLASQGVVAGLVVSGRGCVRCREAAETGGEVIPPLHPGCGCGLAPAET